MDSSQINFYPLYYAVRLTPVANSVWNHIDTE